MNNNKVKNLAEILCPLLILSYFFNHNIYIVFVGVIYSFYLINYTSFNKLIKTIKLRLARNRKIIYLAKTNEFLSQDILKTDIMKKDSELSLVEIVEENGIIPSIEIKEDSNAA